METRGHLGNLVFRTRSALKCDPKNGHILGNQEAVNLWHRDYRKG
jgi:hypothetical protein